MFFKYKVSVIFQCMKYNTIITASKIPWFLDSIGETVPS